MTTTRTTTLPKADLAAADAGSFYTIIGAGGDLAEWTTGYEDLLAQAGCGKPTQWFTATGSEVNVYIGPTRLEDYFDPALTFLFFPLDGMDVGALAIFKIRMEDRWFDDVVANTRPHRY